MSVITETPAADFTREDFDRAWQLDTHTPRHARVRPETAIVLQRNSPHDFQDRQIYVFVDAAPGEQVRLRCGNGMPPAGWLMMIFLHVTYLRVWITRDS